MGNLKEPSLVIGLLQVKAEPWNSIYEKGQLPTWIKSCPPNIEIINIYGQTPNKAIRFFDLIHEKMRWSQLLQGPIHSLDRYLNKFLRKNSNPKWHFEVDTLVKNLFVKTPSTILTLPIIEIVLFKYFLNKTNANYLYMSNTSSYINLDELQKFIQTLPKNKVYGGSMGVFAEINFASGANRILSRDLVEFLVNNFSQWDFSFVEDVSMGQLLAGKFESPINIETTIFSNIQEIEDSDSIQLKSKVHFRLKSGNLNLRNDAELMRCLHKKLSTN